MDIYERTIELLEGYSFRVHRNDEEGYSHLQDGAFLIEVSSDKGDDDLIIEYNEGQLSLFFGNDHDHFDPNYDDEVYWFIDLVEDILNGRKCAASLYYNTDDFPRLLATSFCRKKEAKEGPEKVFDFVYRLSEYRDKLDSNGGRCIFRFWDPSDNFEVVIDKKEKKYS